VAGPSSCRGQLHRCDALAKEGALILRMAQEVGISTLTVARHCHGHAVALQRMALRCRCQGIAMALHGSAMAMPGHWHGRLMALVASPWHCHGNAMSLSAWSCCQRVKEKLHPQSRTNLKMGRIKRGSPAEVTAEETNARILIFGPGAHFRLLERGFWGPSEEHRKRAQGLQK